jgi:6,7-dimethyl-8-ribityllumazine synthase
VSEIEGDPPAPLPVTPLPVTPQPVTPQPVTPQPVTEQQQPGSDTTILLPEAREPAPPAVAFDDPDPFANWPQAVSSAVIEDAPPEGVSVEHVRGEVDVPDGYTLVEGSPLGDRRSVAVIVSRFNGGVTNRLLHRALEALTAAGVAQDAITVVPVPGAFELPLAAMALAKTRRYACIVALGTIVRGETAHFEYVAAECASGLQLAGIETGIPVAFGVLTVDNVAQAEARVDRAAQAVQSALEMADLFARLRAPADA